jgi:hypothetical protein
MDDQTRFESFISDPDLPTFIGPNAAYYQERWRRGFAKKQTLARMSMMASWNWAAFFLSIPWMLWRRMYGMAAVLFIAVLVVQVMEIVSGTSYSGLMVAFAFLTGLYANGWYFQHAVAKLHKAPGGVSWPAAAFGTMALIAAGASLGYFIE